MDIPGFSRPKAGNASATSVGLSLLFLIVYGGCNWITSQRNDVGVFFFEWERTIPFVPFMILPYMSIDLFFVLAPFLCATDLELRLFCRRVTAAILIGGICFLLFPLRFAFPRPHASGWTGALFDWFRGMDAPYNLLPSLHAALWMILVPIYLRHTRGLLRGAAMFWLALVGLAPVLTHQHHLIDIIGGFALAGYCFYFFPEPLARPSLAKNERIGVYYLTGTITLVACAGLSWPVGALFLWPALSLAIAAAAYFGLGPAIFRKTSGRLPASTWFVLGPCLAGQYLSLLYYRRECRPWDEISPNVWIGRKLNNREAAAAVRSGVAAVLDLSAEFSEAKAFRAITYKNVPVLDLTAPTLEQLSKMGSFIHQQSKHRIVYVHCKIGYSRSAAAVAAYLIMIGEVRDVAEATSIIRQARPSVVIRPEVMTALFQFENHLQGQSVRSEPFLLASRKSET